MELYLRSTNAQDDVVPTGPSPDDAADVDKPPLIALRLPAALLANLSTDSRLAINHGEASPGEDDNEANKATAATDALSLTVTHGGTVKQSCVSYPLEAADNEHHHTEYYQSTATALGGTTSKNELHSIGKTNKQYTVKPKSTTTTNLKEIGRKTRRLLEEERKKRKEIVRLDDNECLHLTGQEAAVVAKTSPQPPDTAKMPPKKAGSKPGANARKRKRRVASNIDGWMPNVDDLLSNATAKDDHSKIVRLHGLPIGVKMEHIRKFFHGLNPSLIFVLPSFPSYVQSWDATFDANERNALVKRHSSNFRVFVKFTSAPVADAAIERSGESIGFDKEGAACEKKEAVGATISISPVPKHVASFLHKHMAIHTRKGEYIIDAMTKAEKQLGPVNDMVWQMAMKELKLKQTIIGKRGNHQIDHLSHDYTMPTNKVQYKTLAKTYNTLIDIHAKLEVESSLLLTHTFDPSCMEDSVHRITQSVSNWLLDEIFFVGRLLKESRRRSESYA
ncbi:hypothetical protein ACHAXR_007525 [Thalassiosira sp. AJA248-18]